MSANLRSTNRVDWRGRASFIVARVLLASAALLLASAGVAGSASKTKARGLTKPPTLQFDKATVTLTTRTSSGGVVTGWTVPAADGKACAAFDIAELPRPMGVVGANAGPALCVRQAPPGGETESAKPREPARMAMVLYLPRPGGNFNVVVIGYAAAESGIIRFALDGATGSISSIGGQFVAELGVAAARGLPPRGGPYVISGYDAAGNRLSSDDVNAAILAGREP